jgi:hypothetical protein
LNKYIRGYRFTEQDVYNLYEICTYEDAVTGAESPLYELSRCPNCTSCGLFRPEEFLAFEYLDDLWFHGFDGPGSPFSGALG